MQSVADRRAAGSLGRRVQQIVQQPLDGTEMRQALEALAATYNTPTHKQAATNSAQPETAIYATQSEAAGRHRDVRGEMQEHTQQLDADFVRALSSVNAVFADLELSVQHLDAQCMGLRAQVNSTLRATAATAAQASLLVEEQRELGMRETVAQGVLQTFTLSDADTRVLERADIDDAFFAVLDRVDRMRRECQRLSIGAEQPAVADLLAQLALQEEQAYAALLRWVLAEVRELSRDAPEFSARLKQALARLEPHHALFSAATEEISGVRRDALHRAFISALVRGGKNGTPRPIEAHAADPQRFVGDMLAWVHQASASERELLDTIFSRSAHAAQVPKMLAAALDGVARPLEIRVQQTVAEVTSPAAVYRIDSLLEFYSALFVRVCAADSPFITTVAALAAQARDKLAAKLDALADAVGSDMDAQSGAVSPALDVPASLHALLAAVADILRLHEDSMQAQDTQSSIVTLVAAVLKRVQSEAHELTLQLAQLRPYEQTMLELNIQSAVIQTLDGFMSMSASSESLQSIHSSEALTETLQSQLLEVLKQKSHLPFDSGPAESAESLAQSVTMFNHTLKAAMDLDVSRLVSRLNNHALSRLVSEHAIQMFVREYAALYQQIVDSGLEDPTILLSPDTVSTLL
ncbi:Golgi transport complex subunit 6 [Coemansia erecta]|nr:Golgi transport complex subunit 6 [Coemansia erecta]